MTSSLRTRLLLGTIGGMVLMLACFSLIVYALIRQALLGEFDRSLTSTAEIMAASVEIDANDIEVEFEIRQTPEFNDAGRSALYQIWKTDGEVVTKSPLLGGHDLPCFYGPASAPARRAFTDPCDHRPHRAIGVHFSPRAEMEDPNDLHATAAHQALILVVARDAGALHDHLNFLKWLLLHAAGVTAGLTLLVGNFAVRRGLHPLRLIAAQIADVNERSLDAQIGSEFTPSEIAPIRDRLNDLLSRLREAFERERRFSANVAHELRNPLAGMRSTIEVTLTRDRGSSEYRQALSECLGIANGMQAMVGNLLLLARMDADQMVFHTEGIALSEMVDSSWEAFSAKATERELTFDNRIPEDLVLMCDRQSLLVIFSNLLDNAVEYTNRGGRVWMQAEETDDAVKIVTANTGCRLSPDQIAKVFDRFWRADPSRSDAGTHCGLGLSLVWRITQAMGGSVRAAVEDGTFIVRLKLPSPNQ